MRPFDFLTFSNKLLIDNWLRISKNVNHISDHGFKCLLGSVISTDKSYSKVPLRLCLYTFFRKICQLPIYFRYIIPGMLIYQKFSHNTELFPSFWHCETRKIRLDKNVVYPFGMLSFMEKNTRFVKMPYVPAELYRQRRLESIST